MVAILSAWMLARMALNAVDGMLARDFGLKSPLGAFLNELTDVLSDAALTAGTEFPVVPCYLDGAYRAWPKGRWIPRPHKLRLHIGAPMTFADKAPVKDDAVAIADALRESVERLRATLPD
jgi:1-acyl-sn-glycerol-3-phosphate acyltransferase